MKKYFIVLLYFLTILCTKNGWSQDSVRKPNMKSKKMNVSAAAKKLDVAFAENNEIEIAKNYEIIAADFDRKGNKVKAEEYLKKAQAIYIRRKENNSIKLVSRSLAKNQESQKDYPAALENYKIASENATTASEERINSNDSKRIQNIPNPAIQEKLIEENIVLATKTADKNDVADGYLQKAEIQNQAMNAAGAIVSYNKAIEYSTKPAERTVIESKLAIIYTQKGQFEKAIAINEKLIDIAEKTKNYSNQILHLNALAAVYIKKQDTDNAIETLKKAYKIASQFGSTAEAKISLLALLNIYKNSKEEKQQIILFDDFLQKIDNIIAKDSSLLESKNFQIIEDKIYQLEQEKFLKDELISRKNKFNYFLIASLLLLLLLIFLITKSFFSIKKQNKKIALQSLRREMNPHFIFNSLNSVNQFISENKELEANKYLTSYSNLMRDTMENSNKDFINLSSELNQIQKYLELEHQRFSDKFSFEIIIDKNIDCETIFVPNMLLQPHLENAIWHGLRYHIAKGLLILKIVKSENQLQIIIDDNGIGLSRSKALKTANQNAHQSVGLANTKERIDLLNQLYKKNITFQISEKTPPEQGTIVDILMPIILLKP